MTNDADEPRGVPKNPEATHDKERGTFERIVPELFRRVIETGTKNISPETVQKLVGELKLPKEALHYTFSQLDETKNGVYRVVSKEFRELFDRTNLSDELAKALSSLSLEVKMDVRFKPTRTGEEPGRSPAETPPPKANDEN